METRVALIGIIVENSESTAQLNALLHDAGQYIIGQRSFHMPRSFHRKVCPMRVHFIPAGQKRAKDYPRLTECVIISFNRFYALNIDRVFDPLTCIIREVRHCLWQNDRNHHHLPRARLRPRMRP